MFMVYEAASRLHFSHKLLRNCGILFPAARGRKIFGKKSGHLKKCNLAAQNDKLALIRLLFYPYFSNQKRRILVKNLQNGTAYIHL
jgi:hypothetical protein